MPPLDPEQFWISMFSGDPQAVVYESRADLLDASEVIVVGSVVDIQPGRAIPGSPELTAYMANVTLRVDQAIKGDVVTTRKGFLSLETVIGVGSDFPADLFDRLKRSRVDEPAVLMLLSREEWMRRLGVPDGSLGGGRDIYALIGGQGFVRNVAGVAEWSPFAGWRAQDDGRPFADVVLDIQAGARP